MQAKWNQFNQAEKYTALNISVNKNKVIHIKYRKKIQSGSMNLKDVDAFIDTVAVLSKHGRTQEDIKRRDIFGKRCIRNTKTKPKLSKSNIVAEIWRMIRTVENKLTV